MTIADLLPEVTELDDLGQRVAALFAILQTKVGAGGSFRISSKSMAIAIGFRGDPFDVWLRGRRLIGLGLVVLCARATAQGSEIDEPRREILRRPD
jgi:hypothetical protein